MTAAPDPQVVIVGAGPAGLALAIELGSRRVPCLLIEKSERAGLAPRAKTTHSRTREHMRRWGIADRLAEASPFGVDYPSNVVFVTRLGGHLLKRFENALDCSPERNEHYSEHGQWVPQYKLEAVLRHHAETLPDVQIRFGQELVGFEQDGDSVTAHIRDNLNGRDWSQRTRYLVGADGARSLVRDLIGAKMVGTYGLSRNYNVIFRAPGLERKHPHGPGIMFWQINAEVPSLIGPMDVDDLWFFMPTKIDAATRPTPAEAEAMIRRSTGIEHDYNVLSSDEWVASRLLADRYRDGRVFLTGDACHLHPPFGGFGMNLGVSDSVDLGWKFAAVLQGWADPALLDSYEPERRQVHELVLDAAEANHTVLANQLVAPGIEDDTPQGEAARARVTELIETHKRGEFFARGVVLGYCYRDSPVVIDDGTQADWRRSLSYVPAAIPGCIAPHRWLADGSSLYDHFGPGFTLLVTTADCEPAIAAARKAASARGIPLTVLSLPDAGLAELYDAKLALIRPDQHVAWRGEAEGFDEILDIVSGRRSHAAHEADPRTSPVGVSATRLA